MDALAARKLVALEDRARAAARELGQVSNDLNSLGLEVKISAWDWDKSGDIASLCPQGRVSVNIVPKDSRPSR